MTQRVDPTQLGRWERKSQRLKRDIAQAQREAIEELEELRRHDFTTRMNKGMARLRSLTRHLEDDPEIKRQLETLPEDLAQLNQEKALKAYQTMNDQQQAWRGRQLAYVHAQSNARKVRY